MGVTRFFMLDKGCVEYKGKTTDVGYRDQEIKMEIGEKVKKYLKK